MRVALIASSDAEATRALAVARALRRAGDDAALVVPQTSAMPERPSFASAWEAAGIPWIPVGASRLNNGQPYYPRDPRQQISVSLAELLRTFDVCWFLEPEWAMQTVRERRFRARALPVLVIDDERGDDGLPRVIADMNRLGARDYARRWGDLVFSASEDVEATTQQVRALWQRRIAEPPRVPRQATTTPAFTVCIPYFEEPAFLSEALHSLEQQTSNDFTVIVVDDGSESETAVRAFAECRERYSTRGWKFLRQENSGPGAARNLAAQHAESEFLLFLDADDLAMPRMIESFHDAMLLSGDDCLVARNYAFEKDPQGSCTMLYDPPGTSLVASMGDDMHGGSCICMTREAFMRLGGFTVLRGIGFEDYELHIRANLAGMRWDVLPEFVYRYRMPRGGGVSRSTKLYPNMARVSRWYRERLGGTRLEALPLAIAGAHLKNDRLGDRLRGLEDYFAPWKAKRSAQGRERKLLVLTCHFPFEMQSGWHNRVHQMLRYLGSRYQITLMNLMTRELIEKHRAETFAHVHTVLGVEGSAHSAIRDVGVPLRVRENYTDLFQKAVRDLPTDQFHAAILDQLFMAEFRHDIETKCVLTEHNIESRLLRQASERSWGSDLPLHFQNAMHEAALLERYEDKAWREFPLRTTVSEEDRAEVNRRAPGKTVVVPNGADPTTWIADARFEAATVLFSGHLAYLPNTDAVQFLVHDVWPKVRARVPVAKLILAGRAPTAAVQAVAGRNKSLGVTLASSPKSMDEVARTSSVTVAPLRLGSGTRIKILESLAWGLPVVSTAIGAEGIAVQDGETILLRDDADGFADAIVQLLKNREMWTRLRENGAALVRERYTWERAFATMDEALVELIG